MNILQLYNKNNRNSRVFLRAKNKSSIISIWDVAQINLVNLCDHTTKRVQKTKVYREKNFFLLPGIQNPPL